MPKANLTLDTKLIIPTQVMSRLVGEETVPAAWRSTVGVIKLSQVTPWHPGKPFLYDLTIDILRHGKTIGEILKRTQ